MGNDTTNVMPTSNQIELNTSTRVGWKCPECHACHSPDVSMCERCAPPYYAQPIQVHPYTPYIPYVPTTIPNVPNGPWWGIVPPYHFGSEIISTTTSDSPESD